MAEQKRSSKRRKSGGSRGGGRRSSNGGKPKRQFDDYSIVDPREIPEGPDVLVDVPVVKVDEIDFELDDLRAHRALRS